MSMNIVLYAKKDGIKELFNIIQTPTDITKKILNSENKIKAYISYITERAEGQTDLDGYNWYHDHLEEFNAFIEYFREKNITLYWEMM